MNITQTVTGSNEQTAPPTEAAEENATGEAPGSDASAEPPPVFDGPEVADVIEIMQDPETHNLIGDYSQWMLERLSTLETLTELSVILCALTAGIMLRRFLRPKLQSAVNNMTVSFFLKNVLGNMTKLVFHVSALLIVYLAMIITAYLHSDWSLALLDAAAKLLTAWIFIRLVAQIIQNNFLRNLIATGAWLVAALSIVGLLEPTATTLEAIGFTIGSTRITLLAVLKSIIIITLLLALSHFTARLAEQRLRRNTSLTPSAQVLIGKIVKIFLIGCALLFGITLSGIDLSAFAIFGGALGLGIGFGLQKVISNLFSGILLLADRSIKPGDIIEMPDGVFGWIGQLNARYVSIVTRDNKEYLIPNEDFITQPVINWSFSNKLIRVETKFGVHYNSDPHLVKRLAQEAAGKPDRIIHDPAPVCHLVEFGDSSLNFVLRFWIEDAEEGVTNMRGAVMLELWDSFQEHGIEIPYPHRQVYVHQAAPSSEAA